MIQSRYMLCCGCLLAIHCLHLHAMYNAALFKPVWQSSVVENWIPNIGNDGNINNLNCDTYFTHTDYDDPAWWMVDLQGQFVIEQIIFTNRGDCCANRVQNFKIDVFVTDPRILNNFLNISGDICFNRTDPLGYGTFTWNCTKAVTGRFLRLIRYGKNPLHFVELEVIVSDETKRLAYFTNQLNSVLSIPAIASVNVSTPKECAKCCLHVRSSSRCTAFNWFASISQCQMLSVDTRQKSSILSQLKPSPEAIFYMETI